METILNTILSNLPQDELWILGPSKCVIMLKVWSVKLEPNKTLLLISFFVSTLREQDQIE